MLCMPPEIIQTIATQLRTDAPWLALTRRRSLSLEVGHACSEWEPEYLSGTREQSWQLVLEPGVKPRF
jgi:hypothetical protein